MKHHHKNIRSTRSRTKKVSSSAPAAIEVLYLQLGGRRRSCSRVQVAGISAPLSSRQGQPQSSHVVKHGLHQRQKILAPGGYHETTAADQFLLAASHVPRWYRATFHRGLHASPNARTERSRRVDVLVFMLTRTLTSTGPLLSDRSGNLQLLDGGPQGRDTDVRSACGAGTASTFAHNHQVGFSSNISSASSTSSELGYLRPARGVLSRAHAMPAIDHVTSTSNLRSDSEGTSLTRSTWQHGSIPRQAPPMFVAMLASLKDLVADLSSPPHFRTYAWWIYGVDNAQQKLTAKTEIFSHAPLSWTLLQPHWCQMGSLSVGPLFSRVGAVSSRLSSSSPATNHQGWSILWELRDGRSSWDPESRV